MVEVRCALTYYDLLFHVPRIDLQSIYGRSRSIEDTEKVMKRALPTDDGDGKTYRVMYAVHAISDPTSDAVEGSSHCSRHDNVATNFIGLVTLRSLNPDDLVLPEHLGAATTSTLTVDLAYSFLPIAWGKGYATEALNAVFDACRRGQSFWAPYPKLYVRALVNGENPASLRVMHKTGMTFKDIYVWKGEALFLAGAWTERSSLHVFGTHLLG